MLEKEHPTGVTLIDNFRVVLSSTYNYNFYEFTYIYIYIITQNVNREIPIFIDRNE